MTKEKLIPLMVGELQTNFETYDDCGEVNTTLLGENFAFEYELYENEGHDIPEYVFEAAVEAEMKYVEYSKAEG